ncbi:MAG: zinc ribbon domain-containing protein [Candidatus Bathyarchaeia archaeon]
MDKAERLNAIIAIGNPKGIEYKTNWRGIQVIEVNEAYTSKRCCKCGTIGNSKWKSTRTFRVFSMRD